MRWGDYLILMAAVNGLNTSAPRKAALLRHIWRPRRFRALLDRYAGRAPMPAARAALLKAQDPFAKAGTQIGLRSLDALHLAGALSIEASAILTYDIRLAEAARAHGLEVIAPQ